MGSRWFNLTIVLVWLSTTTWLLVAKIVPPLRRGEPPNYRSMYSEQASDTPAYVGWEMSLNGRSLGYAVIILTKKMNGDVTEVESRIHFDHIPLEELSPAWMKAVLHSTVVPTDNLKMFVNSRLSIDKLGYLSEFRSDLRVAGFPDTVTIRGTINGTVLKIKVTSGDIEYPFDTYLPSDALVADELSPQLCLTGLHVGQEWTVPVFSPLRLQEIRSMCCRPASSGTICLCGKDKPFQSAWWNTALTPARHFHQPVILAPNFGCETMARS